MSTNIGEINGNLLKIFLNQMFFINVTGDPGTQCFACLPRKATINVGLSKVCACAIVSSLGDHYFVIFGGFNFLPEGVVLVF